MAKRDSTSTVARARKGRSVKSGRSSDIPRQDRQRGSRGSELSAAVDAERRRLLKDEAVLNCVSVALVGPSADMKDGTTYAMTVDVARDFVQDSMNRLELLDRQLKPGRGDRTARAAAES